MTFLNNRIRQNPPICGPLDFVVEEGGGFVLMLFSPERLDELWDFFSLFFCAKHHNLTLHSFPPDLVISFFKWVGRFVLENPPPMED